MLRKQLLLALLLISSCIIKASGNNDTLTIIDAFARLYADNTKGFSPEKGALIEEKGSTRTWGINFPMVQGYRGYVIENNGASYAVLEFLMPTLEQATTMYSEVKRRIPLTMGKRFSTRERKDDNQGNLFVYNTTFFFEDLQDSILIPASKWYHWKTTLAKPGTENFYVITITLQGKPEKITLKPDPAAETSLDKTISLFLDKKTYSMKTESLFGIHPEVSSYEVVYYFSAPGMTLTNDEASKLYDKLKSLLIKKTTGRFSKKDEDEYPLWKSKKYVITKSVKDTDTISYSITLEFNNLGKTGVTLTFKIDEDDEFGL